MLKLVSKNIGGFVRKTKGFVLWIADDQRTILRTLEIFKTYPPLTSRIRCQLFFLKQCLEKKDVNWYLANRSLKYENQQGIVFEILRDGFGESSSFKFPDYFPE